MERHSEALYHFEAAEKIFDSWMQGCQSRLKACVGETRQLVLSSPNYAAGWHWADTVLHWSDFP